MNDERKIKKVLKYATSFKKVPYKQVGKNLPIGDKPPFWNTNGDVPKKKDVTSLVCVGLTNLMRRYMGLKIPGLIGKPSKFPGGTGEYWNHFKKKKVLELLDINKVYPEGTLLLRNYNPKDQGHVAVILNSHKNGFLYSEIIHATGYDKPKMVRVESAGREQFRKAGEPTFTHVVLPQNWLLKE